MSNERLVIIMRVTSFVILCFVVTNPVYQVNGRYYYYTGDDSWSWSWGFGSSSSGESPSYIAPSLPPTTQQDKDDATKIVDSKFDEKMIASILPYRTLDHRKIVNNEIANIHKGKRLIGEKYLPTHKKNPPFKDLCFALVHDPLTVLTMYLGEFLHRKDETFIIMALTLCQQMSEMHEIYDRKHKNNLNKRRSKQRHPFSNLMRVWIERDRDPAEPCTFRQDEIDKDVDSLTKEYPDWNDKRDSLENTLIKKCLKFALAVVKKFEANQNIIIEDAIKQKISNHDLVDAYTSLALYVKDKYNYMAKILQTYCDGSDRWAVWIMMVGFISADDWPKIDAAFRKINNNVSLKDHILANGEPDKIFLQVMAHIIDPKYKANFL